MKPDNERFEKALSVLELSPHRRFNIGTYKERTQHLVLKYYFEPDSAFHEVKYLGKIADIKNDSGIIEIQTSGFSALRGKLEVFLRDDRVTVVTPVVERKRVVWADTDSGDTFPGKYRSHPSYKYKFLSELFSISAYFPNDKLTIILAGVDDDEYKLLDGYGEDRKKRATKLDTVPAKLNSLTVIKNQDNIRALLPFRAGEKLTSKTLAEKLGMKGIKLWCAVKFLSECGILIVCGKSGNSIIYTLTEN